MAHASIVLYVFGLQNSFLTFASEHYHSHLSAQSNQAQKDSLVTHSFFDALPIAIFCRNSSISTAVQTDNTKHANTKEKKKKKQKK